VLIHPVFIVFVAEFAQNLQIPVRMEHANGRM